MRFKVTFSNSGGELDSTVVGSRTDARDAMLKMLSGVPHVEAGDTFTVTETEEELTEA